MSSLFVEGRPVGDFGGILADHAYIVYQDDDGIEFVIRGGPSGENGDGIIQIQNRLELDASLDKRGLDDTPESRGQTLIPLTDGRSATAVYDLLLQLSDQIRDAQIDYVFNGPNSNSVVATLLQMVGISFDSVRPASGTIGGFAGSGVIFDFDRNIVGTELRDVIYGAGGADTLTGEDGNDLLNGNAGTDTLSGGGGRDILIGYGDSDRDVLEGGSGLDWYYLGSGDVARETVADGVRDEYYLSWVGGSRTQIQDIENFKYSYAWSFVPTAPQTASQLRLLDDNGQGADPAISEFTSTVTVPDTLSDLFHAGLADHAEMSETGAFSVTGADGGVTFVGLNFADGDIHLDVGRESRSRVGTDGNDDMRGTSRADLLIGGAGNDEIEGRSGDDEISGEGGHDEIEGGSGNDRLYGDRGNDEIEGGAGNDRIWGGSDNDRLRGDSGNDVLSGNAGNDRLDGGSGNDRLLGGGDFDWLTGDSGSDTFVFHFGDGADVITDFEAGRSHSGWWGHGGNGPHHGDRDRIEIDDDIAGFDTFADILVHATQVGQNTVIDFGHGDTLTLEHVRLSSLNNGDFLFV
jgi:Ca2+-binding RTX toxin-like protein